MLLVKQARLILVSSKEEIKICLSVFLFGNKEGLSVFQIKKILNVNVVLVSKENMNILLLARVLVITKKSII